MTIVKYGISVFEPLFILRWVQKAFFQAIKQHGDDGDKRGLLNKEFDLIKVPPEYKDRQLMHEYIN